MIMHRFGRTVEAAGTWCHIHFVYSINCSVSTDIIKRMGELQELEHMLTNEEIVQMYLSIT